MGWGSIVKSRYIITGLNRGSELRAAGGVKGIGSRVSALGSGIVAAVGCEELKRKYPMFTVVRLFKPIMHGGLGVVEQNFVVKGWLTYCVLRIA